MKTVSQLTDRESAMHEAFWACDAVTKPADASATEIAIFEAYELVEAGHLRDGMARLGSAVSQ